MISFDIILIVSLLFLILWNASFRFKKLINLLVGFKENDALINFGILWVISVSFIMLGDLIKILNNIYSSELKLANGYYIIGAILILGLIGNLFLALTFSRNKKKSQIINIIQKQKEDEKEEQQIEDSSIKGLFN